MAESNHRNSRIDCCAVCVSSVSLEILNLLNVGYLLQLKLARANL